MTLHDVQALPGAGIPDANGKYYVQVTALNAGDIDRAINQDDMSTNYTLNVNATVANQAPTNISLNKTSIAENQPAGSVVGRLSTTDPDAGDTFTYALVPGAGSTDNSAFEIVGNTLKAKAPFDFETKNAYSVRVRTTDSAGLTFDKELQITVSDVVETVLPKTPHPTGKPIVGTSKNDRLPGTSEDTLKLTGGLTFSNLTITQQDSDTLIGVGNNPFAILTGVNVSQITAADFV